MEDYELIAQELSNLRDAVKDLAGKVDRLGKRVSETERVNARLEDAALTTARALADISHHWAAVYEAMRREELLDADENSG